VVVIVLGVVVAVVGIDAIAFQHEKTIFADSQELTYRNN